jgi:hypothetical protein
MMGSIGQAVGSSRLTQIADTAAWVLPFEGLYRDALMRLLGGVGGATGALVRLGPLGNSHDGGPLMLPWALTYTGLVLVLAVVLLRRRDL